MIKIGLTGNIASGKSETQRIIESFGYKVLDLDIVSHNILDNNNVVRKKILNTFKTLNRKELAEIIFNDSKKRKELESIIHPELNKIINQFFLDNKKDTALFVSGATIFESNFDKTFDKIILIDADKELKINRLMKRNSLSKQEAIKRLETQQNNIDKTQYIINNNSTIEVLAIEIKKILKEIIEQ